MSITRTITNTVAAWHGRIPSPKKWVFIVGCYNSGTTLLHDLLASHSQIGAMPREGQFLTDQLRLPKAEGLPRLWALDPDRFQLDEHSRASIDVDRLKRQWGARYNDANQPVLLEKSPTNAARTRWLQKHFVPAYFIGIIRNGYAVAEGIHRKAGHPIELAARQWARSNEIMLRDFDVLDQSLLLRYERLAAAPDACLRELFEFIGVEPEKLSVGDEVWEIHERRSPIKNMNDQSFDRLTQAEVDVIDRVAYDLLEQFDYVEGTRSV